MSSPAGGVSLASRILHQIHFSSRPVLVPIRSDDIPTLASLILEQPGLPARKAWLQARKGQKLVHLRSQLVAQLVDDPLFNEADPLPETLQRLRRQEQGPALIVVEQADRLPDELIRELLALDQDPATAAIRLVLLSSVAWCGQLQAQLPAPLRSTLVVLESAAVAAPEPPKALAPAPAPTATRRRVSPAFLLIPLLAAGAAGIWWWLPGVDTPAVPSEVPSPGVALDQDEAPSQTPPADTAPEREVTAADPLAQLAGQWPTAVTPVPVPEVPASGGRPEASTEVAPETEQPAEALPAADMLAQPAEAPTVAAGEQSAASNAAAEALDAVEPPGEPAAEPVEMPAAEPEPVAEPEKAAQPPAKSASLPGMPPAPALAESHYTLQLAALSSEKTLGRFLRQHQLTSDPLVATYRTSRQGKPWFVVVYGDYASLAEGKRALAELPPKLKAMGPWLKSGRQVAADLNRVD